MVSKVQVNDFNRKVFCMNTNRPVEVKAIDHGLLEFSQEIKPSESVLKEHRGYAQQVGYFDC